MGFESAGVRSNGNIGYNYSGKIQMLSSESLTLASLDSLLNKNNVKYDYSAEVQDINQIAEEAAARAEEDDGGILDWLASTGATIIVGVTTVASGVVKLGENIVDGVIWVRGTVAAGVAKMIGADELAEDIENWTMDTIAFDAVGEFNEWLYEDTFMSAVNDASNLKYDSELAQNIQDITTDVAFYAGATVLTMATGGAAAPVFALGFAAGAGESAENSFQDTENRSYWRDSFEIGIDGTIKGIAAVGGGKAGVSLVSGVKSLFDGKFLANLKKVFDLFADGSIGKTLRHDIPKIIAGNIKGTFLDPDVWGETLAVVLEDIKSGFKTGDWDVEKMLVSAGGVIFSNFFYSLGGEALNTADTRRHLDIANDFDEIYLHGEHTSGPDLWERGRDTTKTGFDDEEFRPNTKFAEHEWDVGAVEAMSASNEFQSTKENFAQGLVAGVLNFGATGATVVSPVGIRVNN